MADKVEKTPEQEGPRSFARSLELIDDGRLHTELSKAQHELLGKLRLASRVRQSPVSGKLTMTVDYAVSGENCTVKWDVTAKEPKPTRLPSAMFVTKGGNLSVEPAQKQFELPLRVARSDDEQRVAAEDVAPARGV